MCQGLMVLIAKYGDTMHLQSPHCIITGPTDYDHSNKTVKVQITSVVAGISACVPLRNFQGSNRRLSHTENYHKGW